MSKILMTSPLSSHPSSSNNNQLLLLLFICLCSRWRRIERGRERERGEEKKIRK
jgi:hypothetical protein